MDGKRFIQWEYIIFYTGRDYRPNNVLQKLKNWRPVPASPLLLLPWIIYLSENVWIIVPVLICKRLNIHLYSSALSLIRLCRQVVQSPEVSIELLTMHHYYWTQVRLIPWYVTMIYKETVLDFLTIELRDFLYFISVPSLPFLLKSFWTSLYLLSFTIWFLQTEENL